jgi:hypothetical protein
VSALFAPLSRWCWRADIEYATGRTAKTGDVCYVYVWPRGSPSRDAFLKLSPTKHGCLGSLLCTRPPAHHTVAYSRKANGVQAPVFDRSRTSNTTRPTSPLVADIDFGLLGFHGTSVKLKHTRWRTYLSPRQEPPCRRGSNLAPASSACNLGRYHLHLSICG